ncbi:sigma 54-interacting transcriptional regulator [Bacillus tianshenii]|nr:sigma 54-interacting transcriptional regulator [Bacillus tianshenii]
MSESSLLSKEMLERILNGIDEAIHAVDHNGVTIYYNRVASEHDGMSWEEVMGRHILQVFPSLTSQTSTLLKVLETKKPIYHKNQRYENKKGVMIETINTTVPLVVEGQVLGAVEIAKNYGKIKMLSNQLMDLKTKMYKKDHTLPKQSPEVHFTLNDFITVDPVCRRIIEEAFLFASSDLPVIIYGKTGTGKEILAQGIHAASIRRGAPFIVQNCGAIPETLLESLLFGTSKGSYTGAVEKAGLLELAHGGTLFLDELNSMPLELQTKLLRVLEDGTIRRVGGVTAYKVDVRIITALNEIPENCVKENRLREDLYYRLSTCSISLPSLMERKMDIPILANHFLSRSTHKKSTVKHQLAESVIRIFQSYPWPGNVRELKNTIEYVLVKSQEDLITEKDLPNKFLSTANLFLADENKSLRQVLHETEKACIQDALRKTDGNVQKAAKLLQIPRQTLQYKMTRLIENKSQRFQAAEKLAAADQNTQQG